MKNDNWKKKCFREPFDIHDTFSILVKLKPLVESNIVTDRDLLVA